tara:strand:- start:101 stop:631 length:531 start_codon:yes stop_codon:yes gene_type:complete
MKSFRKYISELRENTKLPKDTITVLQADDDKYDRGLRVKYGKDGSYTIQYWINDSDKVAEIEVEIDGKSVKKNAKNIKLLYHPQLKEEKSAAWQRKAGKNKEGGLNAKGRASYERENPGSDLKAPVSAKTASKNPDGKAANRRKSFCARMGGMPGPMKDEKGRPTRKALALRKWDC